ncbi:MAG: cytochrome c biogenesis protein CcsA [Rhodanobacteraceae bacterium]|nr:cytochrome c biogenesis protein CcsA [Rhodanobacteraceae bacterium]
MAPVPRCCCWRRSACAMTRPGGRSVPGRLPSRHTRHAVRSDLAWRAAEHQLSSARLSLVAWAMATVMTITSAGSRARVLLAMIWPIALLAAAASALVPNATASALSGWQIRLHVVIALSAYALLSIAALQAVVVAWQERSLRRKHLSLALRALPPLSAMEELLFQYIIAGFALLTLTVLSGALFIEDWMAQHLVHKTVLTILAWVVFGMLIFGRWRFGWRGRTAVNWTLAGMGVLLLGFFGSKLVLELVLAR